MLKIYKWERVRGASQWRGWRTCETRGQCKGIQLSMRSVLDSRRIPTDPYHDHHLSLQQQQQLSHIHSPHITLFLFALCTRLTFINSTELYIPWFWYPFLMFFSPPLPAVVYFSWRICPCPVPKIMDCFRTPHSKISSINLMRNCRLVVTVG